MSLIPRRVIVTTVPFGKIDPTPINILNASGIELVINPIGRKLKPDEVRDVIAGFPAVIAGTETIDVETLKSCPDLKVICRVGVGLDSVDLLAARKLGITVCYTPEAPALAVSELVVGLMIDLLRGISAADSGMQKGQWNRIFGSRLATSTVGVVGVGRIGRLLIQHLIGGFPGVKILANDLAISKDIVGVEWVDKKTLYQYSDIISLHVPLTHKTMNMITSRELAYMKPSSVLINTARGGIVNEADLATALRSGTIQAAAVDVFEDEPYSGPLISVPNALLTCHMGSMTTDCRARMELEATKEAIRFLTGQQLESVVPESEYEYTDRGSSD